MIYHGLYGLSTYIIITKANLSHTKLRDGAIYPGCSVVTTKVQDVRRHRRQDRRLRGKVVFLMLIKRRFRCLFCGKVFIP